MVDRLTERQAAVLRLVAFGLSNPEIGARLGLSRVYVDTLLRDTYAALGVGNRTGAALTLVEPPATLGGCLVFANQQSALAALASREER